MTSPYCRKHLPATLFLFAALATTAWPFAAHAQSSCSSDGVTPPSSITERFFSADCTDCWTAQASEVNKNAAFLDWIVPSPANDDAPLSAAATRDAIYRLQALNARKVIELRPDQKIDVSANRTSTHSTPVKRLPPYTLRVAMGQLVSGYIGTSIELQNLPPYAKRPAIERKQTGPLQDYTPGWTAHLVLLEAVPAGAEGNTAARFIVRNTQTTSWDLREKPLNSPGIARASPAQAISNRQFFDSRPLSVPSGTNPERLQLLGWVQNEVGTVMAAAQTRCKP